MMDEFEDMGNSREGWEIMQRLIWAFMMEFTRKDIKDLYIAFEKWMESKSHEELDEILAPEIEEETIERNLEEEGRLHSKEDILRSMWKDND